MRLFASFCLSASLLITGCALTSPGIPAATPGVAFSGTLHGGQQPIVGARIYLLAPGTAGYGTASASLLTTGTAGTDTVGAYVLSDANGNFSVTGDYSCTPGTQAYLLALGGNPGAGTNPAVGLMTVLGACPTATTYALADPLVTINEVSTIAAAYAMAGFATDATHVASSGSTAALTGLKNAFAATANLTGLRYGNALTATPNGNGTVPQAEIDTLANILSACINSTGTQGVCPTLLAATPNAAGAVPTETATAAINLAHRPAVNTATIYNLQPATGAPFMPTLTAAPNDFSIGIVWNISSGPLAFDAAGNLFTLADTGLLKYSNAGTLLSSATGYTGGGVGASNTPISLAIDPSNNVWLTSYNATTNVGNNYLSELSNTGTAYSPATGYTGGGLYLPTALTIDGFGSVWAANSHLGQVSKFANTGVAATGSPFATSGQALIFGLVTDGNGNVYAASGAASGTGPTAYPIAPYALTEVNNGGALLRYDVTSSTSQYTNLSLDASNNLWGTIYPTTGSNQIFKFTSIGGIPAGFPLTGNTAIQQCLASQIDGDGNFWCASDDDSIAEISPTGAAISPAAGYVVPNAFGPEFLAIDNAGNVWTTGNYNYVNNNFYGLTVELIGAAAPVVTPTSFAIYQNKLAARP